jgi:transaldolase / glucose-6-phosphate isomerase
MNGTVGDRLQRMESDRIIERIWERDHTVWKDDPSEIADRLGWLDLPELMRKRVGELETFAERVTSAGFHTAVLLGMGGSSLAPEVVMRTLGAAEGAQDLIVLDTTHPVTVRRISEQLELRRTLFIVASKSGTTVETLSHFAHFWEAARNGDQFVAITDAGTPLETLARDHGFRAVFLNPPDVGGRYSALSLFGLVPAAVVGGPLLELLDGALAMRRRCERPVSENPGALLGAAMGEFARSGYDKLTLCLPRPAASLGDWIEQLVAESTGKQGTGIVPIVGEPLGAPDAYGRDRVFAKMDAADLDPLERAGHPVVTISDGVAGATGLGAQFFRWEMATAVAGSVLGINPFDQPNVQEAKDATKEILASGSMEDPEFDGLGPLLEQVGAGDYVAILAYLDRTPETEKAIERARLAIRDRYHVATTTGFGPRFLHSTGQLHKGGPNSGVFIQLVDTERSKDLAIPGESYTFGTLIDAQALGDLRSLRRRGRRVARITLDELAEVG